MLLIGLSWLIYIMGLVRSTLFLSRFCTNRFLVFSSKAPHSIPDMMGGG
jgi:hypothetical protein